MKQYASTLTRTIATFQLTTLAGLSWVASGCAGPHTPLGAVWSLGPKVATAVRSIANIETDSQRPSIHFTPARQILHGPSPIRVEITDPEQGFDNYQLSVRYNGFEISDTFLRRSKFTHNWQDRTLIIENPVVRLPATSDHVIEFIYTNSKSQTIYARYDSPTCNAFRARGIATTGQFRPTRQILELIYQSATRENINPAFLTGLIAQESQFDPHQVSWAKAIGLTQITATAESEIIGNHEDWPQFPGIDNLSTEDIRILIEAGNINSDNEWRLDPAHSVEGGIQYIHQLSERWSNEANRARIRAAIPHDDDDQEISLTRLILASYHSGYARVSSALDHYGKEWLKSPELKGARKYVNSIFSYCEHFSGPEGDDSETSS